MNSLQQLQDKIRVCKLCDLCKNNPQGTNPVPGKGPHNAKLMIIGEAPSTEEIYSETPFIGRCGKLLRKTLKDTRIDPELCYITNINKCMSRKGNKNVPASKENQKICAQNWLSQEIKLISPSAIMTCGAIPLFWIFPSILKKAKLGDLIVDTIDNGPYTFSYQPTLNTWPDSLVFPNYHPSYLLQHGRKYLDVFIKQIQNIKESLNGQ